MNESFDQSPHKRPTIITVFAILTLVSCGFSLISALLPSDLFSGNSNVPTPPRDDMMRLADAFLAMVKIGGAVLILQMRKIGVFLYVGAELLVAALMVFNLKKQLDFFDEMAFYNDMPIDPAIFTIIGVAFGLIFSAVWIGVYVANLKKMR